MIIAPAMLISVKGNQVEWLRIHKNLTVGGLAKQAGVHRNTICKIEHRPQAFIRYDVAKVIATVFDLHVPTVFPEVDDVGE